FRFVLIPGGSPIRGVVSSGVLDLNNYYEVAKAFNIPNEQVHLMKLSTACLRIFFSTIAWCGCFIAVAIAEPPFITTWETTANNESITIPTYPFAVYDYSVDWGDGQTDASITGDATHTYATAGVYTVSITSSFPHIYFNGGGDKDKLLTIEQWGD